MFSRMFHRMDLSVLDHLQSFSFLQISILLLGLSLRWFVAFYSFLFSIIELNLCQDRSMIGTNFGWYLGGLVLDQNLPQLHRHLVIFFENQFNSVSLMGVYHRFGPLHGRLAVFGQSSQRFHSRLNNLVVDYIHHFEYYLLDLNTSTTNQYTSSFQIRSHVLVQNFL